MTTMRRIAFLVVSLCLATSQLFALGDRGSPVTEEAMIYILSGCQFSQAGKGGARP